MSKKGHTEKENPLLNIEFTRQELKSLKTAISLAENREVAIRGKYYKLDKTLQDAWQTGAVARYVKVYVPIMYVLLCIMVVAGGKVEFLSIILIIYLITNFAINYFLTRKIPDDFINHLIPTGRNAKEEQK